MLCLHSECSNHCECMEKNKGLNNLLNMNPGYVKNVTLLPGQTVISLTLFTYNLMKAIYIFLLIDLRSIVKYCDVGILAIIACFLWNFVLY